MPRGFGGIKAAFHGDFAVEAAAEVLFERIGGHNILQQQRQIERLFIGVDAAGELELPFFQQLRGQIRNAHQTIIVYGEFAQQGAHRYAACISGRCGAVEQVDRAFQRQAFCKCRHHGGVKIQLGFGQAGNKGLRVDAVALNLNMVDFFIQLFGKRMQHGLCIEADAFAGKMGACAHILQAAAQAQVVFHADVVEHAGAVESAVERKRRLQAERDAAGRHAPRRLQVLHVQ